ncbi:hypothetical protein GIB67_034973 [Kingdonia uniflora]|uniref:Uncharacterized protein n=1 Tax=Kingdonia uniflora TaxID=39325 RepID=A0A7J7NHI1_9MAGN|nr:hypothetical protein GIB67_034973 [Kingdonia uniflora]
MDGQELDGRTIRVSYANDKPAGPRGFGGGGGYGGGGGGYGGGGTVVEGRRGTRVGRVCLPPIFLGTVDGTLVFRHRLSYLIKWYLIFMVGLMNIGIGCYDMF